ncbi:hypothetical protein HDV57DRAFT_9259 [Trichoderma longibrachiatum]|uniref:Uncharacterized protein n=1 Tax=Trichoderma longibrachiatum ATCC 18648 TaxID=983965 RepID=A0A2T4CJC6_TRILO|nr:hypothetical protein M440DRAFT_1021826 [Trichoderma longibrachiatum ATCC 18648]
MTDLDCPNASDHAACLPACLPVIHRISDLGRTGLLARSYSYAPCLAGSRHGWRRKISAVGNNERSLEYEARCSVALTEVCLNVCFSSETLTRSPIGPAGEVMRTADSELDIKHSAALLGNCLPGDGSNALVLRLRDMSNERCRDASDETRGDEVAVQADVRSAVELSRREPCVNRCVPLEGRTDVTCRRPTLPIVRQLPGQV